MEKLVKIKIDNIVLEGQLVIPQGAKAIVLFAHGSGSSRLSPRNTFVASVLQKAKIATLLFDLLTEEEDEIYQTRFNIELLTKRLVLATQWIKNNEDTRNLKIGFFGASTGAAAALKGATFLGKDIGAIVSRGGRPDLAMDVLDKVTSPTLLIIGGDDFGVIELNKQAFDNLKSIRKLEIVPGATHLFEEPGALEKVAELASKWFIKYLR
ncbi:MAG: dienelactone hydrolase family protein [Patescibacteria group bacterium]|nr:dienelactone hydrolase family protein [Patescibacteria group bacterium]